MIGAAAIGTLLAASVTSQVVLRGESEPIDAPVVRITPGGVEVGGEQPGVLSWDRVKLVLGPDSEGAARHLRLGGQAWRARTRLDRGDLGLACPLFAALLDEVRDQEGPTRPVIGAGALACCLALRDHEGALEAWLIMQGGEWSGPGRPESIIEDIDGSTGLAPMLPPMWAGDEGLPGIIDRLRDFERDRVGRWYLAAAGAQLGVAGVPSAGTLDSRSEAEHLVAAIVIALHQEGERRTIARGVLEQEIESNRDGWREAWARLGLGVSLLRDGDQSLKDQGVAHLVHIPARFAESLPRPARLATLALAEEMTRRGDAGTAARLRTIAEELRSLRPLSTEPSQP